MLKYLLNQSQRNPLFIAMQLIFQTYIVTLIGLAIGIFSARSLSVSDRGALALLLLISQLFSRLGSLGFEQIILRDGFKNFGPIDFYIASFSGTVIAIPFIIGFFLFSKSMFIFIFPGIIAVFVISVLRINTALLIHENNIKLLTILNVGQALFQLVLYILVFNFHHFEYFYIAWLFNITVFSLISMYLIHIRFSFFNNNNTLNIWREGISFTGIVIPEMVLAFCLELPFIRLALGGVQTGLYSISNTITSIYFQMYYAVSAILIKKRTSIPRIPIYLALLAAGVIIWIASEPIISFVFGDRYTGAAIYLSWMMPVTALLGTVRIVQVTAKKQIPSRLQIILAIAFFGSIFLTTFIKNNSLVVPYIAFCYALTSIVSLIAIGRYNP